MDECERCNLELIPYDDETDNCDEANCDDVDQDLCDHCRDEGFISSSHADMIYDTMKDEGYKSK